MKTSTEIEAPIPVSGYYKFSISYPCSWLSGFLAFSLLVGVLGSWAFSQRSNEFPLAPKRLK